MNTPDTRRWWALGALAISVLVVGLDLTVLNLALPTLARDLLEIVAATPPDVVALGRGTNAAAVAKVVRSRLGREARR